MNEKNLKESAQFFDEFVSASLKNEANSYDALEVVKHYNVIREELAKLLVEKE